MITPAQLHHAVGHDRKLAQPTFHRCWGNEAVMGIQHSKKPTPEIEPTTNTQLKGSTGMASRKGRQGESMVSIAGDQSWAGPPGWLMAGTDELRLDRGVETP